MNQISLPLRHRRIINELRHANGYLTGAELAKTLNVSVRTIRMDIAAINETLSGSGVTIRSRHRYGYIIEADNIDNLNLITQTSNTYISRDERMHHIAMRLSLSDDPINLDELADEMYISKTTLEHDLKAFRTNYLLPEPHICMYRNRNSICFEKDERKRRAILCRLYADSWNYNGRGNIFYQYDFLEERIVNLCILEINYYLSSNDIRLEDVNIVYLDLAIAVAYYRIQSGHLLESHSDRIYLEPKAVKACNELLDSLENRLHCCFSPLDREDMSILISCGMLQDMDKIREIGIKKYYPADLIHLADRYLASINEKYGIDFSENQDFYLTLLHYFRYLSLPIHRLNDSGLPLNQLQVEYAIEFELAFQFEPLALSYYGNYLNYLELYYLIQLLSGALIDMGQTKIRTVIMSHYNLPVNWNLKKLVEDTFPRSIQTTTLLPMYMKDNFDFSNTDLILSTTDKTIVENNRIPTIRVSSSFTNEDKERIERFLLQDRFRRLYGHDYPNLYTILANASWNEGLNFNTYFDLLEYLGKKMIDHGYVDEKYLIEVFLREKILSSTQHRHFTIVHATCPAKKTHLEIGILNHRIRTENNKIRMVIMVCMTKKDQGLIFKLFNELYTGDFDPADTRFLKTKQEYLHFFQRLKTEKLSI